ncbi:MAG: ABC transporter permease [Planctomycetes bacterium]|nr:ABC transporter permease [Planctomycetota bacterium]
MSAVAIVGGLVTWGVEPASANANVLSRVVGSLGDLVAPASTLAILALGALIVIVSGGIDLSVGAVFALAAVASTDVVERLDVGAAPERVVPIALGVALGIGALCGLVNGLLIGGLRLRPALATFATFAVFRGVAVTCFAEPSSPSALLRVFSDAGFELANFDVSIQPAPLAIALTVLVLAWLFLARTVPGRELIAVGSNAEAARHAGLAVRRINGGAYVLAGLAAGLAAFVATGARGAPPFVASPDTELAVLAAALLGGASLAGGRGSPLSVVLGALLLALIQRGVEVLARFDVPREASTPVLGLVLLVALVLDRRATTSRER